jgi:hypothetical protein
VVFIEIIAKDWTLVQCWACEEFRVDLEGARRICERCAEELRTIKGT